MTTLEWLQLASVLASPLFAAAGAYGAVKARLDALDNGHRTIRDELSRAQARIDAILHGRH